MVMLRGTIIKVKQLAQGLIASIPLPPYTSIVWATNAGIQNTLKYIIDKHYSFCNRHNLNINTGRTLSGRTLPLLHF